MRYVGQNDSAISATKLVTMSLDAMKANGAQEVLLRAGFDTSYHSERFLVLDLGRP